MVSIIGYIVLYARTTPGVGYAGAFLAAVGVFPTIAVDIAWAGGNAGGDTKRGVVLALVVGLGNLGGCVISSILSCESTGSDHLQHMLVVRIH